MKTQDILQNNNNMTHLLDLTGPALYFTLRLCPDF